MMFGLSNCKVSLSQELKFKLLVFPTVCTLRLQQHLVQPKTSSRFLWLSGTKAQADGTAGAATRCC